ncbi:MAG TPA: hypothetical protein VNQ53_19025 [Nocardioides sp.]|nr:hypothetical protein [Nocardioides sp.]
MSYSGVRRFVACAILLPLAITLTPPAATADHAGDDPGPIHAGNTFGWWQSLVYREEFHGSMPKYWRVDGKGVVQHQNGMLTLNTTDSGSVSATLKRKGATTGRWETRLRSRRYGTGGENFRVLTELVPADPKAYRCGAQNISLNDYLIGRKTVQFQIRTLPDNAFRGHLGKVDLGMDEWHTYAVEVKPKRISWFVDSHVIHSERRRAALSGVRLTVRFTMQAVPGKRMNPSRMQMDWMRHWSTKTPNTKSVVAPKTDRGTYAGAC